ncbi:UNVERIFIED_CONTAM: hypothetical protein PYX00_001434 [Menopon gallinae]|uniref:Uncharacterized protein n=1 Tax=Menopon gallinae TaxID=328185 RepID=A0AAW2IDH1_9NEOP
MRTYSLEERTKTDVIEEHLRNQLMERPGSRGSSTYQRSVSSYGDFFRSPLTASCRSSYHRPHSSASDVDTVLLQSQVTTLQWQLRQAEASRQMHRAVLEQVVSFLQRTHKNLDQLQNRILDGDVAKINRVPRSRSVHGVDTSPSRLSSPRSESNLSFQKAKSVAQIADPFCPKHGNVYRDMTWRRPRKQQYDPEELTPSKLSEEAFRLLRTVQSLLNTREPDLSSRLSNGLGTACSSPGHAAEVSSASSTVSAALDSDNSDNFQSQETLRNRTPIQDPFGEEQSRPGTRSRGRFDEKNSPPQLSISSADDESGFSSLNSFQEIGLPVCNSTANGLPKAGHYQKNGQSHPDEGINLQEVGLPTLDEVSCKIHRRWSSTPADNISKIRTPVLANGEVLRVLWV